MLKLEIYNYSIRNWLYKNYMSIFTNKVFNLLSPGKKYIPNWHINLIANKLEEIAHQKTKRLIINLPPRSLKSIEVSVAWPAWLLGNDPTKRIIIVTYSQKLSEKHSRDARIIIESDWYRKLFPNTKISRTQNRKSKFATTQGGYVIATSIGGTLTGEGGDIIIIDDPHSAYHAFSNNYRNNVIEWFEKTLLSRLDSKNNGAIILVMQRLHPEDLTGYLLSTQKNIWQHIELGIISKKKSNFKFGLENIIWEKDEILSKKQDSLSNIENLKRQIGTYTFETQYMQNPFLDNYGIIKRNWLKYYYTLPGTLEYYISLDSAVKTGRNNNYSVLSIWGYDQISHYLIHIIREKYEYPELIRLIRNETLKWKPKTVIIEDKSSGQSLYQELKRDLNSHFIAWRPKGPKDMRLAIISPIFEAGNIYLPINAHWLNIYEEELLTFPHSPYDDQIDSTVQYLEYINYKIRESKKLDHLKCRIL